MTSHEYQDEFAFKRPRLDNADSSTNNENRPFSAFFNSVRRSKKHPVLSDKKLIVYNLRVERPPLPIGYEDNAWKRLEEAIHAIQQNQQPKESLEVLYQLCENLCQYNLGNKLCDQLCNECSIYIQQEFANMEQRQVAMQALEVDLGSFLLFSVNTMDGRTFLKAMDSWWKKYCNQLSQIRGIFLYLDRSVVSPLHGSLWNLGMKLFGRVYQQHQHIRDKVVENALVLVQCERDDINTDSSLLQSLLHMLIDLQIYHTDFESRLLSETRRYYSDEGDRLVQDMDMSIYLKHVAHRLHQESVLHVKRYFDKSTKVPLNSIVEQELLTKRAEHILDKSFAFFMQNDFEDDLSMLYRLLRKVNALDLCVKHFREYVKKEGVSILQKKRSVPDREVISMILNFKKKTDIIMGHSFEGDERFAEARRDGFDFFINFKENRTTRLLAAYTDYLLRNYDRMDEHQLEKGLEQGIGLFRYLRGKDFFQALYRRDLSKRLLLDMKSRNAEKNMLTKLRKECGLAYTSQLEGMLRDIKHSHDLMIEFKSLQEGRVTPFNFKANILTYGFWPSYTPVEINLPSEFADVERRYQEFYNTKFSGRKLTWQNSLSVCDVTANYPNGTKELTLTLLQTVIVLLFNDPAMESLGFRDILESTNLDELELRRTLKSLACGDHKLLRKSPDTEDVDDTDIFFYNHDYTTSLQRIRMNTEKLKEVIDSNANVPRTVLTDRENQVDAVIVRIMKSKRRLVHGALLSDVMRQIQFPITAKDFKKRIEILIEKQYLVRADNDIYEYLE
ncbi:cullin 4 [Lichtheimia hyalospora FSU 10163]|nr:cullin 4 [Lichtheimia hyalospora FSU 10163]